MSSLEVNNRALIDYFGGAVPSSDLSTPKKRIAFYEDVLGPNWADKVSAGSMDRKEVVISSISNIPELLDSYGKLWFVREPDNLGLGKGKRIATIRMKLRVDPGHEVWWIEDHEVYDLLN